MPVLYRVENPATDVGLWYNKFGEKTDFIKHQIKDAQCADLPMDPDLSIYADGGKWYSACDNIPDMRNWFSVSDLQQFKKAGYGLYLFEVPDYRMANGHAIFLREQAISIEEAPISLLEIK